VSPRRAAWLLPLVLGCGSLPTTGDGIVELVVPIPTDLSLEPGETRQLTAQAFDRNGVPVEAAVVWSTADATLTVDPTTGRVTGVASSGTGRVQASAGTLHSNLIVFTLVAPPETDPGDGGDTGGGDTGT
jgi:hypothetical protein